MTVASVRIMISSAVNCGKWSVCNLPSRAVVVDVQSRLSADVVCSIAVATSLDTETTDPPAHLSITASSLHTAWIQRQQIHQRTCQSQHHHYTRPGYRDDRYTSATINHSIITAWIQRRQNHQRTCIIHILALFWKSQKMELTKQLKFTNTVWITDSVPWTRSFSGYTSYKYKFYNQLTDLPVACSWVTSLSSGCWSLAGSW